ncbi:hypothetical protein DUI87_15702 [Hirundo rustica rustica]|uniref:RNase H type-1 domain-containing protein n=1 Tax=Hirundo rustica rustica TaxID=333673 RepID=A0A3M0K1R9_HIRRU|nr:hypothetical protein DUI87_15702 [Hirundo rustica rustica]
MGSRWLLLAALLALGARASLEYEVESHVKPSSIFNDQVRFAKARFSRMRTEISRGADETPDPEVDPGVENPKWCGEWERIGRTLKEFSDPPAWEFSCEQIQNPDEVGKYLEENCHDDSKEKKLIAISWALAYAYRTLLDTVGQQTEAGEQGDKSVTQAAANPTATQAVAKPDSGAKTLGDAVGKKGKKHTCKTNQSVGDDPGEGPSVPPDTQSGAEPSGTRSEARPTATRSGDTIESFSLKGLRGLRRDYTRRPDESIISWLVRLWDAAGDVTMLDGTEARHLGSLSHDPVIDQEMMREAHSCSLWERVLRSVAQRYLCADDLYMQQTQWKTIEQGIQRLREMAVAEIVFSDDLNIRNPDLVPCTLVMWRKLVRLGPQEYSSTLALMKRDDTEETVLNMVKKLRAYSDAMHGPTHARITALEIRLQKLKDKMEENHKKLEEEIKEDILQISAVQVRSSSTTRKRSPDREGKSIPRTKLWSLLRECGENMKRWDGESTDALAQRLRELLEGRTMRGSSTKKEAAPVTQCTLLSSRHVGEESVSIAGVIRGSQDFTLVEADVSLTGNEWKKHPIVTGPEAPCILGIDSLQNANFKDPKGFRWVFGMAAVETEGVKQLNTLPGLSENPSAVGLLKVEKHRLPIATSTVHRRQYRTTRDAVIPIHKMIRELESQGVVNKTQATEGEGGSSQLAELKAVQLALDIAERGKWPKLYISTDSWMVANALWDWLERRKKASWQPRGKPIWAADEWKDIATRVEKLPMKVRHVDAHVPKSRANEEHQSNQQVSQATKIEVSKINLGWQHKGELFLARWALDASGHQGSDATYKWARDRGVDLTMDSISQVIHDCETCAAIKQAKRVKPLWYGGQ